MPTTRSARFRPARKTGLTFGYLRYTETQSNRVFVNVECLYGFKVALADGIKRIVKP